MSNRKLEADFSDDEVPAYTERVTFGPNDEWVATWTPELVEQLLANDNEARAELMRLVVDYDADPNPIKVAGRQLAYFQWQVDVLWNGVRIEWVTLADAYNAIAGNAPDFTNWILDGNNISRQTEGVMELRYGNTIIHTMHHDTTPGLEATNAADAVFGYVFGLAHQLGLPLGQNWEIIDD
jgi:hypothetical protein